MTGNSHRVDPTRAQCGGETTKHQSLRTTTHIRRWARPAFSTRATTAGERDLTGNTEAVLRAINIRHHIDVVIDDVAADILDLPSHPAEAAYATQLYSSMRTRRTHWSSKPPPSVKR
jgi:hypothetical protein